MHIPIDHHVLRSYLGEVVIVLPDLEDPTQSEDSQFSSADVRYMGILADCDAQVLVLHPYFVIPHQTDIEREREIARELAPEVVREEQGVRARITRGGVASKARARAGRAEYRPRIVPIAQCDAINLYREEQPREGLAELIKTLPEDLPAIAPPAPGAVPARPHLLAVPEHALLDTLREVEEEHAGSGVTVLHLPCTGSGGPGEPVQLLLAHLATLAEGTELVAEARNLLYACLRLLGEEELHVIDEHPDEVAAIMQAHHASLELREGFPALMGAFLAWQGSSRGLVVGVPALNRVQERFLVQHGCAHPSLVYVVSRG